MPPGPSEGPTWAALPQELVQQVAGLLGDEDRWVERLQGACRRCGACLDSRGAAAAAAWRLLQSHCLIAHCNCTTNFA